MRYCAFCKRMNAGRYHHCQYCGRTFGVRICRHCREVNSREALVCKNCGSAELSETSGPLPYWMVLLKFLSGILIFVLIMGIINNLEFLLSLFVILGFFYLGFLCIPPAVRKILKGIFRYFRTLIMGKRNKR
jgi:ribosomal protein L40E